MLHWLQYVGLLNVECIKDLHDETYAIQVKDFTMEIITTAVCDPTWVFE